MNSRVLDSCQSLKDQILFFSHEESATQDEYVDEILIPLVKFVCQWRAQQKIFQSTYRLSPSIINPSVERANHVYIGLLEQIL